jgi:hypothetical protein
MSQAPCKSSARLRMLSSPVPRLRDISWGVIVKPNTPISYLDLNPVIRRAYPDADVLSISMFSGIRDGLMDDSI